MRFRFCLVTARRLACSCALFGFLSIAAVDAQARQADLSLAKSVNNATPNVGATVTFTITVANNGPATATGVSGTDLLPAGLTFVSATPSQGTYTSATGAWAIGSMATATTATLQINATVTGASAQTNTATVSSGVADPNPGNNTASATVTPQKADLAVAKTVNNATPNVGNTITFTITLTNAGPDTATGVAAGDLLPAGLTFVSATPSQGTYTTVTGAWAIGSLANGANATLQLQATVTVVTRMSNTATITAANQADPVTGNNTATVTVTPRFTDDPLVIGGTLIKAVHVTQLRDRIDAQRSRFGLAGYGWTTVPLTAGAVVQATKVNELRTALQEAYSAAHFTVPTFTDSPLVPGSSMIRALHVNELRSAVIALEGM